MLRIDLKEHETSDALQLSSEDVYCLISEHNNHVDLTPLRDGRYTIKAKSYVGYIVLTDIVITVLPKVRNDNLIYMLSYIFNIPSGIQVMLSEDTPNPVMDIIAMVLLNRVKVLIKKGMYRGYQRKREYLPGIKGKLPVASNLFFIDKLFCEFDDLSYSVYENIIIKATIRLMLSLQISDIVKNEARLLIQMLSNVKDIQLDEDLFSRVHFSRLNTHYKPLIEYCYLIYKSINIRNMSGNIQFSSFIVDMNTIFEEFIRIYLKNNLHGYDIRKRSVSDWATGSRNELVPVIEPDIVITDQLVIDVKYYRDVLTSRGKLKSENLYQIITYMNSFNLPGLLVYPMAELNIQESFTIKNGGIFSIYTLDLTGDLNDFKKSLERLVEFVIQLINISPVKTVSSG